MSEGRRHYTHEDLTINICTVDRPEMLKACLASLIETTPSGTPLQIVFNGTPQSTRAKTLAQAEAWDGPTNFIHIDELVSVDQSHNRALAAVTTPLVNFMGDDDVVLASRVPAIVDAFNTVNPEPSVITTFARRIAGDPSEPTIGSKKDLGPTTVEAWRAAHNSGEPFEMLWPGAVLRTDRLREIGGFEAPFSLSFDNRIFSQLSFLGPVLALPERNFGFRIHQGSLSTSDWQMQNRIVRFVRSCHEANLAGIEEPTYEEFLRSEAAQPISARVHRSLRDRSRINFRKGGELALSGDRIGGFRHLAASAVIWPPAFVEKVRDQAGSGTHARD